MGEPRELPVPLRGTEIYLEAILVELRALRADLSAPAPGAAVIEGSEAVVPVAAQAAPAETADDRRKADAAPALCEAPKPRPKARAKSARKPAVRKAT